ncbi:hypothetical protein BJY00DRAFT_311407 [Aspergillus carlsbadensis]|nr:hypothetical protein BJY00DRAFT_311407 [Aspergillus carlsbadensis]
MSCKIPDEMCSICQTKYTSLASTPLAPKRCPGENIYQTIFTRHLFNIRTFSALQSMATTFARNIKTLSGLDIDPVISGIKYDTEDTGEGDDGTENSLSMYISMLVGFPRPFIFPRYTQSQREASEMLDELVGIGMGTHELPGQPVGIEWTVIRADERDGHQSLVRLVWLGEAVRMAKRVPVCFAWKRTGGMSGGLALCFEEEDEEEEEDDDDDDDDGSNVSGPFQLSL